MIDVRRRQLVAGAGSLALAPALLRSPDAAAQAAPPASILIEICLRDQLDFGHVMVAPGLARDVNLRRGENGNRCALFFNQADLIALPNNVFLTPQSAPLQPHIDTVAMMELGELTYGPVHGHEASNPLRSPGRSGQRMGSGTRLPMWEGEPGRSNGEGANYSSTPTPAALHNYLQKLATPGLRNAVVIKGTQRAGAIYHFGAGLGGAEPDRYQDVAALLRAFPASGAGSSLLPPAQARAMGKGLDALDRALLGRRGVTAQATANHVQQLGEATATLGRTAPGFSLALTAEERSYWSAGVPGRYGRTTIDVWEQAAYAFKLVRSGLVRTVAIEVDIGDVHGERTASQMRDQTLITVLPLVRLIEQLKAAGLYDRSLIVVSTADGGRAPSAGSSGDEGKNGVILAGGMVRGGYYGDIRADSISGDGHRYRYLMPDLASGAPDPTGTLGNDKRVPAAALWRSVMAASGAPATVLDQFPDVSGARVLPWLVRA